MRRIRAISIALICALLFDSSALPGKCSLAAYSEARSFRDALEGRSMEEAISGPVDKDTSSYGDRTSAGPSSVSSVMQTPSSIMLTVPANGNLNNMITTPGASYQQRQQSSDEQQKSTSTGSELEREAGPINGMNGSPMDTEQQLLEQKSVRQMQRNGATSSTGRLNSSAMNNGLMASDAQRTVRQQRQPEGDYSTKSTSNESGVGFGDEQQGASKQPQATKSADSQPSYGDGKQSSGSREQKSMGGYSGVNEEQLQSGAGEQQMINGNSEQQQEQQQEKGFANDGGDDQLMAAKQRAMATMLMSMNNGMKYSQSSSISNSMLNGVKYGDKKPNNMARNMIMSLANKAAYMGQKQKQQQSQRQMAPPLMMTINSDYGKDRLADINNNPIIGSMPMNAMNGMRRGMRRANQRKTEKKMSPAMVNAILNKMMNIKQQEQERNAGSNGYANPSAMAMIMKSSAGAEMLANMVLPQVGGAMADMSTAKREQYKRMMMTAIMQQPNSMSSSAPDINDYAGGQEQPQQQSGGSYTKLKQVGNIPMFAAKNGIPKSASNGNGYKMNPNGIDSNKMSTMSPMAIIMSLMNSAKPGSYDKLEQQKQSAEGNYADRQQKKGNINTNGKSATFNDYDNQRPISTTNGGNLGKSMTKYGGSNEGNDEPEKQSFGGGYGGGNDMDLQQREISPGAKTAGAADNSYSNNGVDLMTMSMDGKDTSSINGIRQTQQRVSDKASFNLNFNYPSASSSTKGQAEYPSSTAMPRPMDAQQAYEQQQQQDEYGATPIGQAEPFAFDYKIEDDYGNGQYRKEESDRNGVVRGSYGYTDVSGIYRHVEYVADENGFRANIKSNEPGLSSEAKTKSNLDSNSSSSSNPNSSSNSQMTPVDSASLAGNSQEMIPDQIQLKEDGEK